MPQTKRQAALAEVRGGVAISPGAATRRTFTAGDGMLLLLPVLAFFAAMIYRVHVPPVSGDTHGYLVYSYDRPVGYPLFISLARSLFGDATAVVPLQLAVLCTAFAYLAIALRRACCRLWLALLCEVFVFANPALFVISSQIMTEALSTALIAVFAAVLMPLIEKTDFRRVVVLGVVGAAAFTVRPVNIALLPAIILAILALCDRRRWQLVVIACAATVCAWAMTPMVHYLRHDEPEIGSPLSRGLFQKTLFRQWPNTGLAARCDETAIEADTKAIDAYLEKAPQGLRDMLEYQISSYLRFQVIMPQISRIHHFRSYASVDPILMCLARADFAVDPGYFIRGTVSQVWDLLDYYTYLSRGERTRLEGYLANHPVPLPQALQKSSGPAIEIPSSRPWALALGMRLFQLSAAALFLWGVAWCVMVMLKGRRPMTLVGRTLCAIGVLGVAFYGEIIITAIVELAQPRYVYPLWPLSCAVVCMGLVLVQAVWPWSRAAEFSGVPDPA